MTVYPSVKGTVLRQAAPYVERWASYILNQQRREAHGKKECF